MKTQLTQGFFFVVGVIGLVFAFVGFFVPGMPWFPFALLASYCFARSSERFHHLLHSSRWFGPALTSWEQTRSIPRSAKVAAVLMIVASFAVTIYFAPVTGVKVGLAVLATALIAFIISRPEPSHTTHPAP